MQKGLLLRVGFCVVIFAFSLYFYLEKQNELTQLRIQFPQLEKQVQIVLEENQRLQFEVDRLENPTRLIELAHCPEFSHLKHPLMREVLTIPEGIALQSKANKNSDLY